jgi:hypothetical protein
MRAELHTLKFRNTGRVDARACYASLFTCPTRSAGLYLVPYQTRGQTTARGRLVHSATSSKMSFCNKPIPSLAVPSDGR